MAMSGHALTTGGTNRTNVARGLRSLTAQFHILSVVHVKKRLLSITKGFWT
jgi:hypothetical protein